VLRVVLYHHLAGTPGPLVDRLGITTPPAVFRAHVRRLARDYEIVDLTQVLSGRLPRRALLITFDDGYRSVKDVALPILAELGLPSVFFISSAFVAPESLPLDNLLCHLLTQVGSAELMSVIGGRAPLSSGTMAEIAGRVAELDYRRRLRLGDELADRFGVDTRRLRAESRLFLESSELANLHESGCEIGNHTSSHLFCRAIVDAAAAQAELADHRLQLEQWSGRPVRSFSYPYGRRLDATPLVERALRDSGHHATFLVESRRNAPRHLGPVWNRVSLTDQPARRLGVELELLPRLRSARDHAKAMKSRP
jgi:peptidoglycan/xylan/chitin deacetylase (PgdA/CDA1 family)